MFHLIAFELFVLGQSNLLDFKTNIQWFVAHLYRYHPVCMSVHLIHPFQVFNYCGLLKHTFTRQNLRSLVPHFWFKYESSKLFAEKLVSSKSLDSQECWVGVLTARMWPRKVLKPGISRLTNKHNSVLTSYALACEGVKHVLFVLWAQRSRSPFLSYYHTGSSTYRGAFVTSCGMFCLHSVSLNSPSTSV